MRRRWTSGETGGHAATVFVSATRPTDVESPLGSQAKSIPGESVATSVLESSGVVCILTDAP